LAESASVWAHFGQSQKQRQNRDQQRDALVVALLVLFEFGSEFVCHQGLAFALWVVIQSGRKV
jgi:hypothetical protein